MLTLNRSQVDVQPEICMSGIWFKNFNSNLWSILSIDNDNTLDFESWNYPIAISLYKIFKKFGYDISSNEKYSFQYNNKFYEMDGTINQEFLNHMVLEVDKSFVNKFFNNLNINPDALNFDVLLTLIAFDESDENGGNLFDNQQIGIMLPALFSKTSRYQIYVHPACLIKPVGKDKKIIKRDEVGFFNPADELEMPAPVKFSERKRYHDPVEECYEMDGSIAAETWYSIRQHGYLAFPSCKKNMFEWFIFFYTLRDLALLQGVEHQNRDWVLHILASMLWEEAGIKYSGSNNRRGTLKVNTTKKDDLTQEQIVDIVGYYLPVYDFFGFFNSTLTLSRQNWKEQQESDRIKYGNITPERAAETKAWWKREIAKHKASQKSFFLPSVSKRRMGGIADIVMGKANSAADIVLAKTKYSATDRIIARAFYERNFNNNLFPMDRLSVRGHSESNDYLRRRVTWISSNFESITKQDNLTDPSGVKSGILIDPANKAEIIGSLNQSLTPTIHGKLADDFINNSKKVSLTDYFTFKGVTPRIDLPVSPFVWGNYLDKISQENSEKIQKLLFEMHELQRFLIVDLDQFFETGGKRPIVLIKSDLPGRSVLQEPFTEVNTYFSAIDDLGVEIRSKGQKPISYSKGMRSIGTEDAEKRLLMMSKAKTVVADVQFSNEILLQ